MRFTITIASALIAAQSSAQVVPTHTTNINVWFGSTATCGDVGRLNAEPHPTGQDAQALSAVWGFLYGISVPFWQNAGLGFKVYDAACRGAPDAPFMTSIISAMGYFGMMARR